MVTPPLRSLVERTRARMRGRQQASEPRERGSLILDILIGMAIFALIAIIAVSAVGQYRMRAYVQTAVSDAEQTATALAAFTTDQAPNGDDAKPMPTGILDDADFEDLDVTVTGTGENVSFVKVTQSIANPDNYEVCVEHRGAYALYDSSEGGLVDSGRLAGSDFNGCGRPVDDGCPDAVAGPEITVPRAMMVNVLGITDAILAQGEPACPEPPAPTEPGQEECEARGGGMYWEPSREEHTENRLAYYAIWNDNSESATGTPWGDGLSRADYEAKTLDGIGSWKGADSVTSDWWPTTPAEEAEFSVVEAEGSQVLGRNGEPVYDSVHVPYKAGYCNAN